MKKKFKKHFPQYAYQGENDKNQIPVEKTLLTQNFDTKEGRELALEMKDWEMGLYKVELVTQDQNNKEVKVEHFFTLFDAEEGQIPSFVAFYPRPDDRAYEPGEHYRLPMLSNGKYQCFNGTGEGQEIAG